MLLFDLDLYIVFVVWLQQPPRSTSTDARLPYTSHFRSCACVRSCVIVKIFGGLSSRLYRDPPCYSRPLTVWETFSMRCGWTLSAPTLYGRTSSSPGR